MIAVKISVEVTGEDTRLSRSLMLKYPEPVTSWVEAAKSRL